MVATVEKKNIPAVEKTVVDIVTEKVHAFMRSGQLDLPKDYSVENALKSAYLTLNTVKDKNDKFVIDNGKLTNVCTKASVANALLDMVIQGLNPAKKQLYFIVYGNQLMAQPSYFGRMAVAQMVNPEIKDWGYAVVYEGDSFKYKTINGKITEIEHTQELSNIDKDKIMGAYAIALNEDRMPIKSEVMTIQQVHQSWKQSRNNPFDDKGELKTNSVHAKFPGDMALRTVINKVAKFIINSSSDNALLLERINRAEDLADAAAVQMEIEDRANVGSVIMITDEPERPTQLPEKGTEIDVTPMREPGDEAGTEEKPKGRGPEF